MLLCDAAGAALTKHAEAMYREAAARQQAEQELSRVRALLASGEETLRIEQEERQRAVQDLAQARAELEEQLEQHRAALTRDAEALYTEAAGRQQAEHELDQVRAELQQRVDEHRAALVRDAEALYTEAAARQLAEQEFQVGGQLGRPSGARFRTYERLKRYLGEIEGTLFTSDLLKAAVDDIYRYPLRQGARDALNRQLRSEATDETLAALVCALREEDRLTQNIGEAERQDPRIICSLGLFQPAVGTDGP